MKTMTTLKKHASFFLFSIPVLFYVIVFTVDYTDANNSNDWFRTKKSRIISCSPNGSSGKVVFNNEQQSVNNTAPADKKNGMAVHTREQPYSI